MINEVETQLHIEDYNKLKNVALTLLIGSCIMFISVIGMSIVS